jgi:hypothetical protein
MELSRAAAPKSHTKRIRALHSGLRAMAGLGLVFTASGAAVAQEAEPQLEQDACVSSFHEAQRLKAEGKYLGAQKELLECAQPECGEALVESCVQMYSMLEAAVPSVVLSAQRGGTQLVNVSVAANGVQLTESLDGKALELDPGAYSLSFRVSGAAPVQQDVVIRAGEKQRPIVAFFPAETPAPVRATPPALPAPAPTVEQSSGGVPVMSYVLGGLGVVGLGTAVAFGVSASNLRDEMSEACAPNCSPSSLEAVDRRSLISNVALGIGAAAVTGAVLVYALTPDSLRGRSSL